MKRAVITGIGIISSLGNTVSDVTESLKQGRSGIKLDEAFVEKGLRSQVSGQVSLTPKDLIDRKLYRFMTDSSGYGYLAMEKAIADAKLEEDLVKNDLTGLIMGTGGTSTEDVVDSVDTFRKGGVRKVGPYRVTRGMNSALSSVLATAFGIRGINYSVTSQVKLTARMAYISGKIDTFPHSNNILEREYLSRLMPTNISLGINYSAPLDDWWLHSAVTAYDAGDRLSTRDKSDNQRIPPTGTPGFAVWDIGGGYTVSKSVQLTLNLQNILDKNYRIHGSGQNEAGINLVASIEYQF